MKAQFITKLRLVDLDGQHMQLEKPLGFYSAELRRVVEAPQGMVTDFASIPQLFANLLPKNGPYDYAAVIHDAGYRDELRLRSGDQTRLTRAQVDALFLEGMAAMNVGTFRRHAMWLAVRLFGQHAWRDTNAAVDR